MSDPIDRDVLAALTTEEDVRLQIVLAAITAGVRPAEIPDAEVDRLTRLVLVGGIPGHAPQSTARWIGFSPSRVTADSASRPLIG